MATPKIIPYEVQLRSTKIKRNISRPVVYTNDLNSAEFQFQVTDMQAGELSGATATTMLYMRDGSFFQNPKEDVELTGTTFSYLLKEDEGDHAGIARIQLVVRFNEGLEDEQNFPSQLYDFEIVNGLETQVAQQIMIHDWTTLTREARAYIDEFAANEILREAEFDNNEFDRNAAFNLAQTNRQNQFSDLTEDLTATLAAADANIEEFDVALQNGIVAANLAEKLEDFEEINNSRLLSTERQLEHKVGGGIKAEPEDLSAATLGLVTGTGGPINLLSIPQDASVKPIKTTFIDVTLSKNILDWSQSISGKFIATAGYISNNADFIVSPLIPVEGLSYLTVMVDNVLFSGVSNRAMFLATESAITGNLLSSIQGQVNTWAVPVGAKYFRFQIQIAHITENTTFMAQSGQVYTGYEAFGAETVVNTISSEETIAARGTFDSLSERLVETDNRINGTIKDLVETDSRINGTIKDLVDGTIKDLVDGTIKVLDCWGDSLTQGNQDGSGVSRPTVMASLLGDDWVVNNFGVGGEMSNTIACRQGGMNPVVKPGCLIPGDTTPVALKIVDNFNNKINFRSELIGPAYNAWSTVNPVFISGIKGDLMRIGTTYSTSEWNFKRSEPGVAFEITRPTTIITNGAKNFKKRVLIIWIGQNTGFDTSKPDELVNQIKYMVDHNGYDKYLIIGLPHSADPSYTWQVAANVALKNEFGRHFIDVEKYLKTPIYDVDGTTILSSYALSDAGLTPTADDLTKIAAQAYPLQIMFDGIHFNQYGYTVIAKLEHKRGHELGYW